MATQLQKYHPVESPSVRTLAWGSRLAGLTRKHLTRWQIRDNLPVIGEWMVHVSRVAIVITSAQWLLSGNGLWFTVGMVAIILTFIAPKLVREPGLRTLTKVCVAGFLAAHIVLGMHCGWYETSAVYDKVIHVLASGVLTALLIAATVQHCSRIQLTLPLSLLVTLVLGVAISAGTVWELFEFTVDRTGLFQAQRGLGDTMLDLVADTVGVGVTLTLYAATVHVKGLTVRLE